mmetsp:Transcript_66551/g.148550  ORF Transcript_66551/g.148550 Transcript_66551/m.148550 type:complete len:322 (-) Transcript_66551:47-1012(-)
MVRALGNRGLPLVDTDHILDYRARRNGLALLDHCLGHLHVRLALRVGIILRSFRQPLCDDILLDAKLVVAHLFGNLAQVLLNAGDDLLARQAREDEVQHRGARFARERAPIAPDEIQAFGLSGGVEFAVLLLHHEGSILLLLEQEHRFHHTVDVDLHALVVLVDLSLENVCHLAGRVQIVAPRIDHHRIRVSVDDFQVVVCSHLNRVHQSVAPPGCDQLRKRARVKARPREAEATVHGIGHNLQSLLSDVQLCAPCRVFLSLQQRFHIAAPGHQHANQSRQHSGFRSRGQLSERGVALVVYGRPSDRGETDVVLLDDGGIE